MRLSVLGASDKSLHSGLWLCGTGHRPDKLLGPRRAAVKVEAQRRVERWRPAKIISGMALGFDQDLAEVAIELGIPLIAAVPFDRQEDRWPTAVVLHYYRLIRQAEQVAIISLPPTSKRDATHKLHLRNQWMLEQVGRSGVVLAAWDGSPGGTAHCYGLAEARGLRIDRINPNELLLASDPGVV